MGTVIALKAIKPQKLNVEPFRRACLNAVGAEGMFQQRELKKTTATWQGALG